MESLAGLENLQRSRFPGTVSEITQQSWPDREPDTALTDPLRTEKAPSTGVKTPTPVTSPLHQELGHVVTERKATASPTTKNQRLIPGNSMDSAQARASWGKQSVWSWGIFVCPCCKDIVLCYRTVSADVMEATKEAKVPAE
ncbi:hypothetical protein P7K49_020590 [Saguinus oedipus]|uniref:Uncharacterized protein n=1 Tax=Saguinus oedipus TaxID=9490 RepID=A0ABQ9V2K0_SAGOE|nr:hypothetical protein P7K49_020590 [Saguinus oedipus]